MSQEKQGGRGGLKRATLGFTLCFHLFPMPTPKSKQSQAWSSSPRGACFLLPREELTSHKEHLTVYKAISLSRPRLIIIRTCRLDLIIPIFQMRACRLREAAWFVRIHTAREWLSYSSDPSPASDSCPEPLSPGASLLGLLRHNCLLGGQPPSHPQGRPEPNRARAPRGWGPRQPEQHVGFVAA